MACDATSATPYIALGLLSAGRNQPLRDKIREVTRAHPNYQKSAAHRFILAASSSSTTAEEQRSRCDLVLLNVTDTPFRCGFKYVLWFAYAHATFPHARYIGAGDDDAYIQLMHFEMDLRNVAAQVGEEVPTLYGMIQWRSHYDNVTHDTSTGFMGWGCSDAQAVGVRSACSNATRRRPVHTGEQLVRSFDEIALRQPTKSPSPSHTKKLQQALMDAPACAQLAANEKRLSAVLLRAVDWELPPFPLPNGPLFAVSRP